MLRYELYVCHSDHTWSDGHFVDVSKEETLGQFIESTDKVAIEKFEKQNPNMDMVVVGVYHVEEISD
jgi:hypothetical protein